MMNLVKITVTLRASKAVTFFMIVAVLIVILAGCAPKPYDIAVTPQPVSQEMRNAMLQVEDASILSMAGDWKILSSSQLTSDWAWSNPVSVITHELQLKQHNTSRVPMEQTIAKYESSDVAYSVWRELRASKIKDSIATIVTQKIDLFSREEQPVTVADNIIYRCERYYDDPHWNSCVARMQYDHYLVHIRGDISKSELSVTQFLGFVELADERMKALLALEEQ